MAGSKTSRAPNKIIIKVFNSYGEFTVDIGKKEYTFFGVEKKDYEYVKDCIRKGWHGKAIQFLRKGFSKPERVK